MCGVNLVGTHKEARSLGEITAFEKLNYFDFFKLFQTKSKNDRNVSIIERNKLLIIKGAEFDSDPCRKLFVVGANGV